MNQFEKPSFYTSAPTSTSNTSAPLNHPCKYACSGWKQGYEADRNSVKESLEILAAAIEKIADPRKRDHREPDAQTEVYCLANIANEAIEAVKQRGDWPLERE